MDFTQYEGIRHFTEIFFIVMHTVSEIHSMVYKFSFLMISDFFFIHPGSTVGFSSSAIFRQLVASLTFPTALMRSWGVAA